MATQDRTLESRTSWSYDLVCLKCNVNISNLLACNDDQFTVGHFWLRLKGISFNTSSHCFSVHAQL